ncbi:MAG: hypothetical protein SGILL_002902 [Bacillariaceae sp.]
MWLNRKNPPEVREFYCLPAIAHTVHLIFTIGAAGFTIFFSGNASWFSDFFLEVGINLSVPFTHILYCTWAYNKFDKVAWEKDKDDKWQFVLDEKYQLLKVKRTIIVAFIVGWLSNYMLPVVIGECDPIPEQCFRRDRGITSTTNFEVRPGFILEFEDMLHRRKVVETALDARGNKNFRVIQNVYNPNRYQIVETWDSIVDMQDFRGSSPAHDLLGAPSTLRMLVKGKMYEEGVFGELPSPECASKGSGALAFEVEDNTCQGVRDQIIDSGTCFWVPGCAYASGSSTVSASSSNRRDEDRGGNHLSFEMDDGRILQGVWYNTRDETLVYEVTQTDVPLSGYVGSISLTSESKGSCIVRYQFSIPLEKGSESASGIREYFRSRIPGYKRLLSSKSPTPAPNQYTSAPKRLWRKSPFSHKTVAIAPR